MGSVSVTLLCTIRVVCCVPYRLVLEALGVYTSPVQHTIIDELIELVVLSDAFASTVLRAAYVAWPRVFD